MDSPQTLRTLYLWKQAEIEPIYGSGSAFMNTASIATHGQMVLYGLDQEHLKSIHKIAETAERPSPGIALPGLMMAGQRITKEKIIMEWEKGWEAGLRTALIAVNCVAREPESVEEVEKVLYEQIEKSIKRQLELLVEMED